MAVSHISVERIAALVGNKFGHPCPVHSSNLRVIRCNHFCLDCRELQQEALCYICQRNHPSHRMLQVRKASWNEVIRVQDIAGLIDITGIHQYERNGFKILHLSKWPGRGPMFGIKRGARTYECISCKRVLMSEAQFCSIGCKVEVEARSPPDDTEYMEEIIKYRDLDDLYPAARVVKKQKLLVEPRCSLKTENVAALSKQSHRAHDAKPPMCSFNKGTALPKSPRKRRPVRAPFY